MQDSTLQLSRQKKTPIRKILFIFGMLLGGGLFVYQFVRSILSVTGSELHIEAPGLIFLAFVAVTAVRGIQMTAWHALMSNVAPSLRWIDVAEKYTVTLLSRYIPGSIWGYISRAEWLRAEHKISYGTTNYVSIIEIGLVILTCLQITILYGVSITTGWLTFLLLLLFAVLLILPWWLLNRMNGWNWFQRLMIKMFRVFETKPIAFTSWLKAALLDLIAWYGFGLSFRWILQSFQPTAAVPLDLATMIYSLAWLAGFLVVFVPSGLGIREQSIITLADHFQLAATAVSTGASILIRLIISGSELVWVLIGLSIKYVRRPKE